MRPNPSFCVWSHRTGQISPHCSHSDMIGRVLRSTYLGGRASLLRPVSTSISSLTVPTRASYPAPRSRFTPQYLSLPFRAFSPSCPLSTAQEDDPFALLGLDFSSIGSNGWDVNLDELKVLWRRSVALTHPDRMGGKSEVSHKKQL